MAYAVIQAGTFPLTLFRFFTQDAIMFFRISWVTSQIFHFLVLKSYVRLQNMT